MFLNPRRTRAGVRRSGLAGFSQGRRLPVYREVLDLEADQAALKDGEFTVVLQPDRTVGQTRVDPVPRLGFGLAVVHGVGGRDNRRLGAGLRFGEAELRPVLGRVATAGMGAMELLTRGRRTAHHPVRADPPDQLDGQIPQDPGQAGDVVVGVHDDRDVRVPGVH